MTKWVRFKSWNMSSDRFLTSEKNVHVLLIEMFNVFLMLQQNSVWFQQELKQKEWITRVVILGNRILSCMTASHCFCNGYRGKKPWLGKNIVWSTGWNNPRKALIGGLATTEIMLKTALNTIQWINQFSFNIFWEGGFWKQLGKMPEKC